MKLTMTSLPNPIPRVHPLPPTYTICESLSIRILLRRSQCQLTGSTLSCFEQCVYQVNSIPRASDSVREHHFSFIVKCVALQAAFLSEEWKMYYVILILYSAERFSHFCEWLMSLYMYVNGASMNYKFRAAPRMHAYAAGGSLSLSGKHSYIYAPEL